MLIFINGIFSIILNLRYLFNRLKCLYDNDFSQKENYLIGYILKKIYKSGNILVNLFNVFILENYQNIMNINTSKYEDKVNLMGGDPQIDHVPGPAPNNHENMKGAEFKNKFLNNKFYDLKCFIDLLKSEFVRTKFSENPKWGKNTFVYIFFTIFFLIMVIMLLIYYLSTSYENIGVNIVTGLVIGAFIIIPNIILPNVLNCYLSYKDNSLNNILKWAILVCSLTGFLFYFISIFIPSYISQIFVYIFTGFIGICYLLLLLYLYFPDKDKAKGGKDDDGTGTGSAVTVGSTTVPPTIGEKDIKYSEDILKLMEEKNSAEEEIRLLKEKLKYLNSKPTSSSFPYSDYLKLKEVTESQAEEIELLQKEKLAGSTVTHIDPVNYLELEEELEKEQELRRLAEEKAKVAMSRLSNRNRIASNYIKLEEELEKERELRILAEELAKSKNTSSNHNEAAGDFNGNTEPLKINLITKINELKTRILTRKDKFNTNFKKELADIQIILNSIKENLQKIKNEKKIIEDINQLLGEDTTLNSTNIKNKLDKFISDVEVIINNKLFN
jgi:hypothetical protein